MYETENKFILDDPSQKKQDPDPVNRKLVY